MGAEAFVQTASGSSAKAAFQQAVTDAAWEHGHGGYTGTLAEKMAFAMIAIPDSFVHDAELAARLPEFHSRAHQYAEQLIMDGDPRIDDKWGPAGCIELGGGAYLFFGWASS